MKKTPWYPGTVKPVRVGYYETRNRPADTPEFKHEIYFDWWDGECFCMGEFGDRLPTWTDAPFLHWRGLTEEQK